MSAVRSFYLSDDVLCVVEQIPRQERSRRVNAILRQHLRPTAARTPIAIDEGYIRRIVRQVLGEQPVGDREAEEQRAVDALGSILGMRDVGEGD